jgi:hypothetical protein
MKSSGNRSMLRLTALSAFPTPAYAGFMRPITTAAMLSAVSLLAFASCGSSLNVSDGGLTGAGGTGGASGGGCGTIQASCRHYTGDSCTEYGGVDAATLMAARDRCIVDTTEPGTWSSTGCAHARAVGGCREAQLGMCSIGWLYVGTVADFQFTCAERGGTWVNP